MHQHPGLTATGTGQHQHILVFSCYGFSLGVVEGRENIGYIHVHILTKLAPGNTAHRIGR